LSTKIHAATDGLGNPVRVIVGLGQENDMARAHDLVAGLAPSALIADKAYDADSLLKAAAKADARAVIPPHSHRKHPRPFDDITYKERNRIERFFNKLKQFRRVATRYDKLLASFIGFTQLAAIAILLR
jgi:putative transposase